MRYLKYPSMALSKLLPFPRCRRSQNHFVALNTNLSQYVDNAYQVTIALSQIRGGLETAIEQYDVFNAAKDFFKVRTKRINIKSLLCLGSWIHEQFSRTVSLHHINTSRYRAKLFDTGPLTNLWLPIFFFFTLK